MNKFDENEFRKKIRSDLQKKHKQKTTTDRTEIEENNDGKLELTPVLKKYLRQIEEEKLYSKHKQFVKCENHLNEIAWFTAIEMAEQHEYFQVWESRRQKFKKKLFPAIKFKIPISNEIEAFRKKIVVEIEADINSRLQKYEELIKHHEQKNQKNRIDDIIEQEE